MERRYDVAVVGLGAMGSQTVLELASRGRRVLGLDRLRPPHTLGSTHGKSRIIREAYFEEPLYVPIVQRAYELWRRLEERSGARLLTVTGGLMLGAPDSEVVAGARASAVAHGLPYEELSARDVRERFPAYAVPDGDVAIFEPRAGFLEPEAAVEATLRLARGAGAELRFDEPVVEVDGGTVRTARATYTADRVVVSAGPWLPELVPELAPHFTVARQPLLWLEPREPELFGPDRFPIFVWEWEPGWAFYGFPDVGDGFKAAIHHHGEATTPASVARELRPEDEAAIRRLVRRYFPAGDGALREAAVCLYTNTPDEHFVVDVLPGDERVIVASPCSGHGFKFAPAVGEALADLAAGEPPRFDLSRFALGRFGAHGRVVVRAARAEDVGAVAAIWERGWHDGHAGHVPQDLVEARTPAAFRARAAGRVADTTVGCVDGAVAGFVMVVGDEVEQVYVARDHRGTGLAQVLLREAERQVRANGHAEAWLVVVAGNTRARAFYERAGWVDGGAFDHRATSDERTIAVPCRRYTKAL